jgi:hypothetical protein
VAELHTAVVELAARLEKGSIDPAWLPRHTFIILSQIQTHAAGVLEDLDADEDFFEGELEAIENSLDTMIDTYEDVKEMLDEALNSFRRNKLVLVKNGDGNINTGERIIQISIGGTDVWRRVVAPESCRLEELHRIIQAVLGWKSSRLFQFSVERPLEGERQKTLDLRTTLGDLRRAGVTELLYEYGTHWTVKIMLLSGQEAFQEGRGIRCVAGANAAPPETVEGPLRFKRFLSALRTSNETEKAVARAELGPEFRSDFFDLPACNRQLSAGLIPERRDKET